MPIIESQVDRNSDEYKKNREKMLAAIAEFRDAEASVQAASEKARIREAVQPVVAKFATEVGEDVVKEVNDALAAFRK